MFIECTRKFDDTYRTCDIQWLSGRRDSQLYRTYIEGSYKGKLWVHDIYQEKDKMLKIPNDFTDKIKCIYHNVDKNLLFVSSRDGKFKCWKLPNEWITQES